MSADVVRGNRVPNEVLHADLDATSSGNTQVVAAITSKKIRVISYLVTNEGASTIKINFQSSTTEITASHMLATDGGGHTRYNYGGLFQTASGEALNLNLSASGTVAVTVEYEEVE